MIHVASDHLQPAQGPQRRGAAGHRRRRRWRRFGRPGAGSAAVPGGLPRSPGARTSGRPRGSWRNWGSATATPSGPTRSARRAATAMRPSRACRSWRRPTPTSRRTASSGRGILHTRLDWDGRPSGCAQHPLQSDLGRQRRRKQWRNGWWSVCPADPQDSRHRRWGLQRLVPVPGPARPLHRHVGQRACGRIAPPGAPQHSPPGSPGCPWTGSMCATCGWLQVPGCCGVSRGPRLSDHLPVEVELLSSARSADRRGTMDLHHPGGPSPGGPSPGGCRAAPSLRSRA